MNRPTGLLKKLINAIETGKQTFTVYLESCSQQDILQSFEYTFQFHNFPYATASTLFSVCCYYRRWDFANILLDEYKIDVHANNDLALIIILTLELEIPSIPDFMQNVLSATTSDDIIKTTITNVLTHDISLQISSIFLVSMRYLKRYIPRPVPSDWLPIARDTLFRSAWAGALQEYTDLIPTSITSEWLDILRDVLCATASIKKLGEHINLIPNPPPEEWISIIRDIFSQAAGAGDVDSLNGLLQLTPRSARRDLLSQAAGQSFVSAAARGSREGCNYLIDDLPVQDLEVIAQYAISYAAGNGHLKIVEWLITVIPTIKTFSIISRAFMSAFNKNKEEIAKYLLDIRVDDEEEVIERLFDQGVTDRNINLTEFLLRNTSSKQRRQNLINRIKVSNSQNTEDGKDSEHNYEAQSSESDHEHNCEAQSSECDPEVKLPENHEISRNSQVFKDSLSNYNQQLDQPKWTGLSPTHHMRYQSNWTRRPRSRQAKFRQGKSTSSDVSVARDHDISGSEPQSGTIVSELVSQMGRTFLLTMMTFWSEITNQRDEMAHLNELMEDRLENLSALLDQDSVSKEEMLALEKDPAIREYYQMLNTRLLCVLFSSMIGGNPRGTPDTIISTIGSWISYFVNPMVGPITDSLGLIIGEVLQHTTNLAAREKINALLRICPNISDAVSLFGKCSRRTALKKKAAILEAVKNGSETKMAENDADRLIDGIVKKHITSIGDRVEQMTQYIINGHVVNQLQPLPDLIQTTINIGESKEEEKGH